MKIFRFLPLWSVLSPIAGWLLIAASDMSLGGWFFLVQAVGLMASVLAAVYHAEMVAHKVGEPFGTLVLALAVTLIEVALIVSLMLTGGEAIKGLARDTVFAAIMIILNGIVGICLLVGASRHGEQKFGLNGVAASMATLAAIAVLTLVLPNYTLSADGPFYSNSQLAFIAVISLVLYCTFILVQTVQHRDYFLPEEAPGNEEVHAAPPSNKVAATCAVLLLACLGAVVLLAKALAPILEVGLVKLGAPNTVIGIVIAAIVLLPEGLAAVRAARANRLQTSLNLAIGSALASIGLTIPAVAVASLMTGWTISLGLDVKSTVLLMLSFMVAAFSLSTGRTTVIQGMVHLVIFAVYLFTTIVP